jgi:micrococcal nuclease
MYFLGTLEKILEGTPKVEAEVVVKKKEIPEQSQVKPEFKKTYDKPYVKGEYKKPYDKNKGFKTNYDTPYVKKDSSTPYVKKDSNEPTSSEKAPKKRPNNCFGVYVKDGDTFDAMYNQERVCFRLAGIDCPEYKEAFSDAATQFLKTKVLRKVVYVEFKGKDIYDREIVEAFEDKEMKISINKQLLQQGLATSERYKNNEGELTHNLLEHIGNKITEAGANITEKGIWSDSQPKVEHETPQSEKNESIAVPAPAPFKRKFPK